MFCRAIQESLVEYQKGFLNSIKPNSKEWSPSSEMSSTNENGSECVPVANGQLPGHVINCDRELANDLELALRISQQEREEEEKRVKEEEELFQQILKLSITEK